MGAIDAAAALPRFDGTVRVRGIDGTVVVHRDRLGIPHVHAGSEADVFFGQGFVTAQDRLFQIEADRLKAYGRFAAVAGSAKLAGDIFARRARLGDAVRAGYDAFDAGTRDVLTAYAAGVNAFLSSTSARPVEFQALDYEPEPWQPWDCVAVFVIRHVLFATMATKLFRARTVVTLGPEALGWFRHEGPMGVDVATIVPPGATDTLRALPLAEWEAEVTALSVLREAMGLGGSNAWALSGTRTASGKPLLGGDPHRLLELPNVYVQVHLACPAFDVVGLAFPGVPGAPHFGQTEHVGWCVTNAQAEYQDLFIERFRSDRDGLLVQTPEGWTPATVVAEPIEVQGAGRHVVETVVTSHGPVVIGDARSGTAMALRSTGLLSAGRSLRVVLPQLRARTVGAVDAALVDWVEPANNFVIGDTAGTLLYRTGGWIPQRPVVNAWIPVPGWDGRHEWAGMIPDAALPRCRNPEGGQIVTANHRIVADDYPHVLGVDYANGHRAARITARLAPLGAARREDFAAIHRDVVSLEALALRDRIVAVDPARLSPAARALRAHLVTWDGTMASESEAAAMYAEVRQQLVRAIANEPRMAALRTSGFADEPMPVFPLELRVALALGTLMGHDAATLFGPGADWAVLVAAALEAAAPEVGAGATWGARHRALPQYVLAGVSGALDAVVAVPMPGLAGDLDCVRAAAGPIGLFDHVGMTSTARYVFDLGDRAGGGWIVPLGTSGHPASPHYTDQQSAWLKGELQPLVTDWAQIEREAEATQRLQPEG